MFPRSLANDPFVVTAPLLLLSDCYNDLLLSRIPLLYDFITVTIPLLQLAHYCHNATANNSQYCHNPIIYCHNRIVVSNSLLSQSHCSYAPYASLTEEVMGN